MKETKPRFTNRIYRAELSLTSAGSPTLKIIPINIHGRSAGHRQVAAFLYDLASEMEKRSDELATKPQWVITVEPYDARVILELADEREKEIANLFLAKLLLDRNLD
jgi:hypothetical protein